jgi:hypothetical protein
VSSLQKSRARNSTFPVKSPGPDRIRPQTFPLCRQRISHCYYLGDQFTVELLGDYRLTQVGPRTRRPGLRDSCLVQLDSGSILNSAKRSAEAMVYTTVAQATYPHREPGPI